MRGASFILILFLAALASREVGISQPADISGGSTPKPAFVVRPPSLTSPIDYFRKLLSSSAAERDVLLQEKPPAQRATLISKVKEYESLKPAEREIRLRQLQLHFYLLPLMRLSPQERSNQVAAIPLSDRPLVEERLQRWDMLPPPLQKELLEFETTRAYFLRLEQSTPSERQLLLSQMPDKLRQWITLAPKERQVKVARFNQFFDLSEEERQKVLGFLPSEDRRQMEPVITTFNQLSEEQRQQCLDSFRRFTNLNPDERQRFLETAQRWQAMPAPERQAWRDLVTNLPPLPPGLVLETNR